MVLGLESASALLREWSCELLVRVVVVVVEAVEARKEEAVGSSETSAGRN